MRKALKKLLFVAANPEDESLVRTDVELREIEAALLAAKQRDSFLLEKKGAVRPQDLQLVLLNLQPNFVHFSGHGSEEGGIALENDRGRAHVVEPEALAELFGMFADSIECVVLSTCYSDRQAAAIAQHIPFVIGMSNRIEDRAATLFSTGFYEALGAGRPVEFAFRAGKSRLRLLNHPQHLSPKLLKGPPQTQHRESAPATARSFQALQKLSASEVQALLSSLRNAAAAESRDSPEVRVQLGLIFLHLKLFDAALSEFEQVASVQPEQSEAYYYSALASIRGRRPRLLPTSEVQRSEKLLETALQLDSESSKSFYLLGLLRYDHYFGNSLPSPLPTYDELFRKAAGKPHNTEEIERLIHAVPVRNPDLLSLLRRQR